MHGTLFSLIGQSKFLPFLRANAFKTTVCRKESQVAMTSNSLEDTTVIGTKASGCIKLKVCFKAFHSDFQAFLFVVFLCSHFTFQFGLRYRTFCFKSNVWSTCHGISSILRFICPIHYLCRFWTL